MALDSCNRNKREEVGYGSRTPGVRAGELIIQAVGENAGREGLQRTPERFAKALEEICSGYQQTALEVVGEGIFKAEGNGLVAVQNLEFFSLCEHHMLPFWGKATVAYYPGEKILGLSKVGRLVELFSRRMQVQERLTFQVAEAIHQILGARAVACRVEAAHMCMMMRGVKKQGSQTVTEHFIGLDQLSSMEQQRIGSAL